MSENDSQSFMELIIKFVNDNSNLVYDQNNTPYSEIMRGNQCQIISMHSQAFNDWIRHGFLLTYNRALRNHDIKDAVEHLACMAKLTGKQVKTALRLAYDGNDCYVNTANKKGEVIKITKDGWQVEPNPSVYFVESNTAEALPIPKQEGTLDLLRDKYLNLGSDDDWYMLVVYLVAAQFDLPSKPFILLNGEQGSAKSTTTRVIRELIDPSRVKAQSTPSSMNDLMLAALNNALVCIDNASKLSQKVMDTACQLCTGAGFRKRRLYTDTDEIAFEITRLLIINGIDADIITAPDLLSRCIQLVLPPIDKSKRLTESVFWQEFEDDRPLILGAIYDIVAKVIASKDTVELNESTRLTDFCRIGVAVEQVMGWQEGSFMNAMNKMQAEALAVALDYDATATAIIKVMEKQSSWKGTAEKLLSQLNLVSDENLKRHSKWPHSTRSLGIRLVKIMPALKEHGIIVEKTKSGDRHISITNENYVPSAPSCTVTKFAQFAAQ
mgnify:CR=1 FL=1